MQSVLIRESHKCDERCTDSLSLLLCVCFFDVPNSLSLALPFELNLSYAQNMSDSIHRQLWDEPTAAAADVNKINPGGAGNGGFIDGCWHHCGYAPGKDDDVGAIVAADGTTPLQGLAIWYAAATQPHREHARWEQQVPTFPCTTCCASTASAKAPHLYAL